MNSLITDDEERCIQCGKVMTSTETETWRTTAGESITVPKSDSSSILFNSLKGEVYFCEECFKSKNFGSFNEDEIAEIYYEFGLTYSDAENPHASVDVLHEGLAIKVTTDMLAALGSAYSELGDKELACEFYRQALAIDPDLWWVRENLKNTIARLE